MADDEDPGPEPVSEPLSFDKKSKGKLYLNIEQGDSDTTNIQETSIAFREIYQNFRDGIVKANRINYKDLGTDSKIETHRRDYKRTIAFFNRDPDIRRYYTKQSNGKRYYELAEHDERMLYGFIQFRRKIDSDRGEVQLVNFGGTLNEKSFRLWASTKERSEAEAGQYGEGLKTAVRIFCSANFSVTILSDCRTFKFKQDSSEGLFLYWTTAKKRLQGEKDAWDAAPRVSHVNKFEPHPWEDVAVKIASDDKGFSNTPLEKISEETFDQWLKITCDIQESKNKISTSSGDLFLDPDYKGCVFLKGLKLERSAFGIKTFHYGYNFHSGTIGREREALKYPTEEAENIQSIWREAIAQWNASSDAVANSKASATTASVDPRKMLLDIFRNKPDSADVAMAARYMSDETSIALWYYLLQEASLEKKFYLQEGDESGTRIIIEELQCTPEVLDKELWKILRQKSKMARTPQEEREHLFEKSKRTSIASLPTFSRQVLNILEVLLNLAFRNEFTRSSDEEELKLVPVEATNLDIHFLHRPEQGKLWINYAKCLDQEEAHRHDVSCVRDSNKNLEDDTFVCDHHVMELFAEATEAISQALDEPISLRQVARETNLASLRLRSMPRFIQCEATNNAKELKVSWKSNEPSLEKQLGRGTIEYLVQVHSVGCSGLTTASDMHCACGGQAKVARSDECYKIFSNLEPMDYYGIVGIKQSNAILARSFKHQRPLKVRANEPRPSLAPAPTVMMLSSPTTGQVDIGSGEDSSMESEDRWYVEQETNQEELFTMLSKPACNFFTAYNASNVQKHAVLVVPPVREVGRKRARPTLDI